MKTINLLTFESIYDSTEDINLIRRYTDMYESYTKFSEIQDFTQFIKQLKNYADDYNLGIFDAFYIGYNIRNISKEFDLLRFGENTIINIEIKRFGSIVKRKEQLLQNKYYLKFLGKQLKLFSYTTDDNKLYLLDDHSNLTEVDFRYLAESLASQEIKFIENIDSLFDISNYLVSPFNAPEKFILGEYFLTSNQHEILEKINKVLEYNKDCSNVLGIEGNPGTGKTLLVYDIYRGAVSKCHESVIIHCGKLNKGQEFLKDKHGYNIASIRNVNEHSIAQLDKYELVIIDEAQRIWKHQLNLIYDFCNNKNISLIFSFDPKQCLSHNEIINDFKKFLEDKTDLIYKLSNKIRLNNEVSQFINCLFDLHMIKPNNKVKSIKDSVSFEYFVNKVEALKYIQYIAKTSWTVVCYTSSIYRQENIDMYGMVSELNAHDVIGQEFDNIVAIIDDNFYYDSDMKLQSKTMYYDMNGMLFQIITRTRKQLKIIIINNIELLEKTIEIIEYYSK